MNEIVKQYFGFTDEDMKSKLILDVIKDLTQPKIDAKIQTCMQVFDATHDEAVQMIKTLPTILDYSVDNIIEKKKFYQAELQCSSQEINALVKRLPAILSRSGKAVHDTEQAYMSKFNLSKGEVISMIKSTPQLVCLSTETMADKANFYVKQFGFTEQDFGRVIKSFPALMTFSIDCVKDKQKFYTNLGFSEQEFRSMVRAFPRIVSFGVDGVQNKIKFYCDTLGVTRKEIIDKLKDTPQLLGLSEQTILSKKQYYKSRFNINDQDFTSMFKSCTSVVIYSPEQVEARINFLVSRGADEQKILKGIKKNPRTLGLPPETLDARIKFYMKEFDLSMDEVINMTNKFVGVLGLSPETVTAKKQFLMEEFAYDSNQLSQLVQTMPVILGLAPEGIRQKHASLQYLGIDGEEIIKSPLLLTIPAHTMETRYTIWRQVVTREQILKRPGLLMTNENKLYARLKFFEDKGLTLTTNSLAMTEKQFVSRFKISTDKLTEIYKLTPEEMENMRANNHQIRELPNNQATHSDHSQIIEL